MIQIPILREINFDKKGPFPKRIAYDIEVYPNFFSVAVADLDSDRLAFYEISSIKNDFAKLHRDFKKFEYCISWNGKEYDSVVLMELFKAFGSKFNPKADKICKYAYTVSKELIEYDVRKYVKPYWIEIDLFLFWSRLIRLSKKLSLKSMANFIRWPWIQELPIAPGSLIKEDQMDELLSYNGNDTLITRELAVTKLKTQIDFRFAVKENFGIHAFCSDGVRIGSDYLKKLYAEALDVSVRSITDENTDFK